MNEKRMEFYAAATLVIALALVVFVGRPGGGSPEALTDADRRELIPLGEKIIAEKIEDDPEAWDSADGPASEEPAAPSPEPDRDQFQIQADYTYSILPTQDGLRSLETGRLHGTPEPLARAGRSLSRIRKALESHPGLVADGLAFYRRCALSQDLAHSVRALCLSNFRYFSQQSSRRVDPGELEEAVPQGIVQASRVLDPVQS